MSSSSGITLVDNTNPPTLPSEPEQFPGPSRSRHVNIAKKFSRNSVRERLARRKYAKFQRDRYGDLVEEDDGQLSRDSSASRSNTSQVVASVSKDSSAGVADNDSSTNGGPAPRCPTTTVAPEECPQESVIDVLYQNERGWFFFGLPMYSEKSLLNLDPPAWMTSDYDESPVDITNAQVPDPSWEWAWKSWYVDMSHDVDEEGWQYSFSFASRFSWHGTHPWCHSFVRRRRWLRKRVRKPRSQDRRDMLGVGTGRSASLMDYFTVGAAPSISRTSSATGRDRSSYIGDLRPSSLSQDEWEEEIPPEEITNTVALSKALRLASLDREKIDAVKEFVQRGGEELVYMEAKVGYLPLLTPEICHDISFFH